MSVMSDFQLKINLYDPGEAEKVIVSVFQLALLNLYIPLVAPGPLN